MRKLRLLSARLKGIKHFYDLNNITKRKKFIYINETLAYYAASYSLLWFFYAYASILPLSSLDFFDLCFYLTAEKQKKNWINFFLIANDNVSSENEIYTNAYN